MTQKIIEIEGENVTLERTADGYVLQGTTLEVFCENDVWYIAVDNTEDTTLAAHLLLQKQAGKGH